jgi:hypothetical protein
MIPLDEQNHLVDTSISRASTTVEIGGDKTLRCLSEGELHYLWSFLIWGSLMVPEVRKHLRQSWGFCERHAWGWLAMECSFRPDFLHGPAVLYNDLIERAHLAFTGVAYSLNLRRRLRNREQCLMCDMGYGPHSRGYPDEYVLKHGRDLTNLEKFAAKTSQYWGKYVCGPCMGRQDRELVCRPHLLHELSSGRLNGADIDIQRHFVVDYVFEQVSVYARSFRWECRDTKTLEGEASLITAIGWCSGWAELLKLLSIC